MPAPMTAIVIDLARCQTLESWVLRAFAFREELVAKRCGFARHAQVAGTRRARRPARRRSEAGWTPSPPRWRPARRVGSCRLSRRQRRQRQPRPRSPEAPSDRAIASWSDERARTAHGRAAQVAIRLPRRSDLRPAQRRSRRARRCRPSGSRAERRRRAAVAACRPAPGMMPSVTSGRPTSVPAAATRASQPRASSKPPPSAAPCNAATNGLGQASIGADHGGQLWLGQRLAELPNVRSGDEGRAGADQDGGDDAVVARHRIDGLEQPAPHFGGAGVDRRVVDHDDGDIAVALEKYTGGHGSVLLRPGRRRRRRRGHPAPAAARTPD